MIKSVLIVGMGGFIGSALRYLVSRFFQLHMESLFPWGTFTVNILGSFLIGILYGLSERGNLHRMAHLPHSGSLWWLLPSPFSNDAFILLQNNEFMRFATYSGLSFFLGLTGL